MTAAPSSASHEVDAELERRIRALQRAYVRAVDGVRLDDWVALFAPDCSYVVITRENVERGLPPASVLRPLPDTVEPDSAAMLEPFGLAVRSVLGYGGVEGRSVLVTGLGPLGLMTMAVAGVSGATQASRSESNPDRLAYAHGYVEQLGSGDVLDAAADGLDRPGAGTDRRARGGRVGRLLRCRGGDRVRHRAVGDGRLGAAAGHLVRPGAVRPLARGDEGDLLPHGARPRRRGLVGGDRPCWPTGGSTCPGWSATGCRWSATGRRPNCCWRARRARF